jgi:hypothetical protein
MTNTGYATLTADPEIVVNRVSHTKIHSRIICTPYSRDMKERTLRKVGQQEANILHVSIKGTTRWPDRMAVTGSLDPQMAVKDFPDCYH